MDDMIIANFLNKAGFARGIHGIESLWLDSQLSVVAAPSRDRALGVIGVGGEKPALSIMIAVR
jgi:hypothetical protein